MGCSHHLWDDPTALRCTREAGHPGGHAYADSHGSFVPDKGQKKERRSPTVS